MVKKTIDFDMTHVDLASARVSVSPEYPISPIHVILCILKERSSLD
jgi:hypothetical protein